jgi:hypothetical protein
MRIQAQDPVLTDLVQSEKFKNASPETKQKVMKAYQEATPDERKEFIYGSDEMEGLVPKPSYGDAVTAQSPDPSGVMMPGPGGFPMSVGKSKAPLREGLGIGASTGIQAGLGAALGAKLGGVGQAVGDVVGGYLGNQAEKAITGREEPFGKPTVGDVLSTGVPAALHTGKGAGRMLTKPAREALEDVETFKNRAIGEGNTGLTQARVAAQTKTAEDLQTWNDQFKKIHEDFDAEAARIARATDKSKAQKAADYQEAVQRRDDLIASHQKAKAETFTEGTKGMTKPNPNPAYERSHAAAAQAGQMDISELNAFAKEKGIDLESPVDPRNPMSRVTGALTKWGVPQKKAAEAYDAAFGEPSGGPSEAQGGKMSLDKVIDTHQELGKAVGALEGLQKKVATELYVKLGKMLDAQKAKSPDAAEAIDSHFEGQSLWKRAKTIEEFQELIDKHTSDALPGKPRINTEPLRNDFNNFLTNDFTIQSTSAAERKQMQDAIDRLPPVGYPKAEPRLRGTPPPDTTEAQVKKNTRLGELGMPPADTAPDYSQASSPWQDPTPRPSKFPFGRAIVARIFGANIGSAVQGQQGSNALAGMASFAIAALPEVVSNAMVKSPNFRVVVENIMKGKKAMGPTEVALITQAAKKMGIPLEDEQ